MIASRRRTANKFADDTKCVRAPMCVVCRSISTVFNSIPLIKATTRNIMQFLFNLIFFFLDIILRITRTKFVRF